MTMKYQDKNVSAEKEGVIVNATIDKSTGILNLYKKDQINGVYTDDSPIQLKLNDISLNIVKTTQSHLDDLKESDDPDDIVEREGTLFLIPLDGYNDEDTDAYQEMVWSKQKGAFENIGTTQLDLDPIQLDINKLKEILEFTTINGVTRSLLLDETEDRLLNLQREKQDKINIVTSWKSTTSDVKYPSEKLVKDSLDGKADSNHTQNSSTIVVANDMPEQGNNDYDDFIYFQYRNYFYETYHLTQSDFNKALFNEVNNKVDTSDLSDVATTGSYTDLTDVEEVEIEVTYSDGSPSETLTLLAKK